MRPKLICIFLLVMFQSKAQDRIDTDRPDQTESAVTVPKKYFQAEFGIGKENYGENNYRIIHPTFLLKYGLGKKIELRLESEYASEYEHLIPNPKTTTAIEPIEIGTKIALFEEKGLLPKTSLLVHVGLPFKKRDPVTEWDVYPSARFSFQHTITETVGLGYNIGFEDNGEKAVWLYTFSPNFNIGKKWYAYVEAFGFREMGWQHALDAGVAYYISNNTKLDLSGGIGLGDNPLRNYVALGFSFRFPTGAKK